MSEQDDIDFETMLSEHNLGEGIFKYSENYVVATQTSLSSELKAYLNESNVVIEQMKPEFHDWLRSLTNPYSLVSTMMGSYVTFSDIDDAESFRKDWQVDGIK